MRTSTWMRLLLPELRELGVLQHVQQLGLQRRLHLADLVEHQRAGVGLLELADARVAAPVNAPRSWPNSSLSRSSAGSAAQFTLTNGRLRRVER